MNTLSDKTQVNTRDQGSKKIEVSCDSKEHVKSIYDFYNENYLTFLSKQKLERMLKKEGKTEHELNTLQGRINTGALNPVFPRFIERLNQFIENPVSYGVDHNPDLYCFDLILFDYYRIKKIPGIDLPTLYVRENWSEIAKDGADFKWQECSATAKDLKDRKWLINFDFFSEDEVEVDWVLETIALIVLSEIFSCEHNMSVDFKNLVESSHLQLTEEMMTSYWCYAKRIPKKVKNGVYNSYLDDATRLSNFNALFLTIIRSSQTKTYNLKVADIQKCMKIINENIRPCFVQKWLDYNKLRDKSFYFVRYLYVLENYKACEESLDRWYLESPLKALYLLKLNVPSNEVMDCNYFSYSNMVLKGAKDKRPYKFESKCDFRRVFNLEISTFRHLLSNGASVSKKRVSEHEAECRNHWKCFTRWISNSKYSGRFNVAVMEKLISKSFSIYGSELKLISDHFSQNHNYVLAFDLLYEIELANHLSMQIEENADSNAPSLNCENSLQNPVKRIDQRERAMIKDYLVGQNPRTQELNILNINRKSTVKSVLRKSEKWHEELQIVALERKLSEYEKARVEVYPHIKNVTIEIDGVTFKSICNRCELLLEGFEMKHCVGEYHKKIECREYVVFSLNKDDFRATLGLNVIQGGFKINQCYGKHNCSVSQEILRVVEKFVEQLNQKKSLILA